MKTTNIGNICCNDNCISMMLDYAGDDNAELMEQIRVEVHNENGCSYILADDVMVLLHTLAKKMQERPLQNIYANDEYNY